MKCTLEFKKDKPNIITDVLEIRSDIWYQGKCDGYKDFLFSRINSTSCFIIFNDGSFGSHRVDSSIFTENFKAQVANSVEIMVS